MSFSYKAESIVFGRALLELATKVHRNNMSHMISEDNIHSFRHGRRWLTLRENGTEESSFKEVGVDLNIEFEKILKNEVSHLFQFLETFVDGFTSQTTKSIYQTISDSCHQVGNTIDRTEFLSDAETFLAMIKLVELSVSSDGEVHLPQIHMGTGAAEKFLGNLELQGEAFKLEVDKIIEEKTRAAYQKEELRVNKFKGRKQ